MEEIEDKTSISSNIFNLFEIAILDHLILKIYFKPKKNSLITLIKYLKHLKALTK